MLHEKGKMFQMQMYHTRTPYAYYMLCKIGAIELFANTHNRIKENVECHQVEKLKWDLMKNMCMRRTACAGCTLMGHTFYMCRLRRHGDNKRKRSQLLSCILSRISVFSGVSPTMNSTTYTRSTRYISAGSMFVL